jgi:hypothetical protein
VLPLNFPAVYGTGRFITVFLRALHWSLSWARSIQSIPSHPAPLRSTLILSTHLRLGLPSGIIPFGFPTDILYGVLFSPLLATCPAHHILLDFIIVLMFGKEYKLWNSSLYIFLRSPVTCSLFGPNILLSPRSQTPSVCVPLLMSETKILTHAEPRQNYNFVYYWVFLRQLILAYIFNFMARIFVKSKQLVYLLKSVALGFSQY